MQANSESGNWQAKALFGLLILMVTRQAVAQSAGLTRIAESRRIVLISIADRKLVVLEKEQIIASFPVAVGAATTPSPTGEFQIINRLTSPTYYHPGTVISGGKHNPLGSRWIGLSKKGYGIHGTNVPKSVGHAASHGCIRLRNRDVEQLFSMVRVGDRVEIHAERDGQLTRWFGPDNQNEIATTIGVSLESAGQ
jgi:lipoprotein-anchoring transpeptidase ErfK/SrfK